LPSSGTTCSELLYRPLGGRKDAGEPQEHPGQDEESHRERSEERTLHQLDEKLQQTLPLLPRLQEYERPLYNRTGPLRRATPRRFARSTRPRPPDHAAAHDPVAGVEDRRLAGSDARDRLRETRNPLAVANLLDLARDGPPL
jgi:hypothetical protein